MDKIKHAFFVQYVFVVRLVAFGIKAVRGTNTKKTEENQLDATEGFIALINCSTCFGHLHAHHQELENILVLLPHMVCNALVVGGRRSGAGQQDMCPG